MIESHYSTHEAADVLGISHSAVRKRIQRGWYVPDYFAGNRAMIPAMQLERDLAPNAWRKFPKSVPCMVFTQAQMAAIRQRLGKRPLEPVSPEDIIGHFHTPSWAYFARARWASNLGAKT